MTLHYITKLRVDNPMTQHTFHAPRLQFVESYNIFDQNLGFEPQNMLWGDSMPNKVRLPGLPLYFWSEEVFRCIEDDLEIYLDHD